MYLDREHLLSVSSERLDERKLEEKVSEKVDERVQALQRIITSYATENLEMKNRMAKMDLENTDLKRRIQRSEQKIAEIEELLNEVLGNK